jgi:hypothetical protein
MKQGNAVMLFDEAQLFYADEQYPNPGINRGLLNAAIIWIPISSVMWAGIIYTAMRLLR